MSFFVTSVGLGDGGNLGGLVGADSHCQALAAAVGAGDRTWRAYLSAHDESSGNATAGTDAVARAAAGGTQAAFARYRIGEGPWVNARGEQVAKDLTELHAESSSLARAAALNEKGREVSANQRSIITGSRPDGTPFPARDDVTCGNWTNNAGARAQVGQAGGAASASASWNSIDSTSWLQSGRVLARRQRRIVLLLCVRAETAHAGLGWPSAGRGMADPSSIDERRKMG